MHRCRRSVSFMYTAVGTRLSTHPPLPPDRRSGPPDPVCGRGLMADSACSVPDMSAIGLTLTARGSEPMASEWRASGGRHLLSILTYSREWPCEHDLHSLVFGVVDVVAGITGRPDRYGPCHTMPRSIGSCRMVPTDTERHRPARAGSRRYPMARTARFRYGAASRLGTARQSQRVMSGSP